jgi:cardiolipin synthase C
LAPQAHLSIFIVDKWHMRSGIAQALIVQRCAIRREALSMKLNRKLVVSVGMVVGAFGIFGGIQDLKMPLSPSPSVNRSFAGAPSSADGPSSSMQPTQSMQHEEFLTDEEKARKIETCGVESLDKDTLSNYPKTPIPYFPGYTRVLADPHEALLAKVALIQAAKKSIDISTYIFSPDSSSNAYVDELRKAIRRGVNVRFLVDDLGSAMLEIKYFYNPIRALLYEAVRDKAEGKNVGTVDVVVFRPIFHLETIASTIRDRYLLDENLATETSNNIDRRSHDKILLIDKEDRAHTYAIVGGRNIDESYYGVPHVDENTYEDMELLVKDDPASKSSFNLGNTLENHFQDLFCAKGNRWLPMPEGKAELVSEVESAGMIEDYGPKLDGALEKLLALDDIRQYYNRIWGAEGNTDVAMQYFDSGLIHSEISPASEEENFDRTFKATVGDPDHNYVEASDSNNADSIYKKFFAMTKTAKKTIDICTPYIFLPPVERDCLKAWVMEDESHHLRILSNSVATSDSAAAMETFDNETAPGMLQEGPYHCTLVDGGVGKHLEGEFKNTDSHGNPRIEVFELGRLDNKMFAGNTINGKPAPASAFYGKLHAKFAIVDGQQSWVGSDNFDERSRHLNSETAIFVNNHQISKDLTEQFDKLAGRSYHYGSKDWKVMRDQKQVQKRVETMKGIEALSDKIPVLGFGN